MNFGAMSLMVGNVIYSLAASVELILICGLFSKSRVSFEIS